MTKSFLGLAFLTFSIAALAATIRLAPFPNPGVVEKDPQLFDRVFAISDTHGMYGNLRTLLTAQHIAAFDNSRVAHWMAKKSLLIVVGDSIDKGPDSLNVLDLWRQLSLQAPSEGGEVLHLLGNHEAEFLSDPTNPKAQVFINELQRKNVPLEQVVSAAFPLGKYLRQMPLAARVGNWLFCHAGFYPSMPWGAFKEQAESLLAGGVYGSPFLIGPTSILEAKDWWADPGTREDLEKRLFSNGFYGLVFGHQPGAFGVHGDIAGVDQLRLIKIDSGMAPKDDDSDERGSQPGHMLLFSNPKDLSAMVPPEVYSLSATSMSRLPTQ
jgi:hypothetical protein